MALTNSQRIPELDGIRGIACLLVIFWHYIVCQLAPPNSFIKTFAGLTWTGVDLFFVLSGFLLGGILIRNRSSKSFFRTFYIRRFFRLYPLYFLLLVGFCLYFANGNDESAGYHWLADQPFPILSYITFLQNFYMVLKNTFGPNWLGITWSLAVEEQFYLILPLLIYLVRPRWLGPMLLLLIFSSIAFRIWIQNYVGHLSFATFVLLPARSDALFLGVLGAWFIQLPSEPMKSKKICAGIQAVFFVFLCGMIYLSVFSNDFISDTMTYWGYTWIACFYILFILLVLSTPQIGRILSLRPLMAIGTVSFGIYMFHQMISGLCYEFFRNTPPFMRVELDAGITLTAFLITLFAAFVSYRFFERPLVRIGQKAKW